MAGENFSYLSSYTNICTPKDPDIEFSMLGLAPDCSSSPAYAYFAIVAQSTGPSIFNNCVLEISHYGGMFAGDSVANGGVFITRGPDFQPGVGNDYDVFDSADISPGVSKVTLGSIYDSSWNGVELTAAGDTMFIVGLRIQNSCETGAVNFVDFFNTDTAYYAQITKVFDHLDSTYVGDSIVAYNCDSICMDTDAEGDCILWSYSTCYDTIHYRYDSVFTITGYHNENYTGIGYRGDSLEARACPMQAEPLNATTVAGTNAYSSPSNLWLLTITGTGFGATRGSIRVSDANSLGTCELDTGDIISWSESKIYVKLPSYLANNQFATPGTGPMTVYNACGDSVNSYLHILYNIEDWHRSGKKLRSVIVMHDSNASLVFHCDSSVYNNPNAFACVKKAVKE